MVGAQYDSNILPAGQRFFGCWHLGYGAFVRPQVACCVTQLVLRSSVMIKLPVNSAVHHAHKCLLPDMPFERRLRHSRERLCLHKQSDRQFVQDTPLSVQSVQSSRSYGAGQNSNLVNVELFNFIRVLAQCC